MKMHMIDLEIELLEKRCGSPITEINENTYKDRVFKATFINKCMVDLSRHPDYVSKIECELGRICFKTLMFPITERVLIDWNIHKILHDNDKATSEEIVDTMINLINENRIPILRFYNCEDYANYNYDTTRLINDRILSTRLYEYILKNFKYTEDDISTLIEMYEPYISLVDYSNALFKVNTLFSNGLVYGTMVPANIKYLIVHSDASKSDIAKELHVSNKFVYDCYSGTITPDSEELVKIAELFNVSLDDIKYNNNYILEGSDNE